MACPYCSAPVPDNARFCPQCGQMMASPAEPPRLQNGWQSLGTFGLTLAGSLLITGILTMVFHLPIFFLGAFLPLFWWRGRR